jgi:hypothetical protein
MRLMQLVIVLGFNDKKSSKNLNLQIKTCWEPVNEFAPLIQLNDWSQKKYGTL